MEMATPRIVESTNYPYLEVRFVLRGREQTVWAYVDTGFDGHLAVPRASIDETTPPDGGFELQVASGDMVPAQAYFGSLELIGLTDPLDAWIVALGNEYILGRAVIDRFRLTFDHGARLIAEA